MKITRRGFLASILASGAMAALPARPSPRLVVKLSGPMFTRGVESQVDPDWLEDCVLNSCWQIDCDGFDGRPLVRHPMTGLTYVASPASGPQISVRQVAAECCRCREDLDPDYVVGHAARRIAAVAFERVPEWRSRHAGPVYLRFSHAWRARWPRLPAPEIADAPRVVVTPYAPAPPGAPEV
jgi:hypothetical protein